MDGKNRAIMEIEDAGIKTAYTKFVLEKLPEWFGNKTARDQYAEETAGLPYWAVLDENDSCIGFLAVQVHYGHTGEIVVCGILPECQHQGIGTALFERAEKYLIQIGCRYVIVKTLSDIAEYEPYARTRKFYEGIGFEPLITLTEMWDENNPCLIMMKCLGKV